jgi:hypothetical protein
MICSSLKGAILENCDALTELGERLVQVAFADQHLVTAAAKITLGHT